MKKENVTLVKLETKDYEQFILDNQRAFKFGATEEFGPRDDHFEEDGEIISRDTIIKCIEEGTAYQIQSQGKVVGGVIVKINEETQHNDLEILYILPEEHSKGFGYGAWLEVERLYPNTIVWETCTPYFEKRNIHFYINKCGFKATKFYCEYNIDPNKMKNPENHDEGPDEMFFFEKVMK